MEAQTFKLLQDLSTKLGVTVEYLWKVLLVQAKIEWMFFCYIYPILIIFITILSRSWLKSYEKWKKQEKNYFNSEFDTAFLILKGICCIFIIIFVTISFFVGLPTAVTALFNPEGWALNEILSRIGR
jgi:small-conductance mechanosensitive channel